MSTLESSATAYDTLSKATDEYAENQARIQVLRNLSVALRAAAYYYAKEDNVSGPVGVALVQMTTALSVERNRLYVANTRLADAMERLNALIQNGVYND